MNKKRLFFGQEIPEGVDQLGISSYHTDEDKLDMKCVVTDGENTEEYDQFVLIGFKDGTLQMCACVQPLGFYAAFKALAEALEEQIEKAPTPIVLQIQLAMLRDAFGTEKEG